jgi:hypothetical protein
MMKVSEAVEHMRKTHAGVAGGHRASAATHRADAAREHTLSKCHAMALGKAVAGDPQHTFHTTAKAAHDASAIAHEDAATDQEQRAQYHDDMAQECTKAAKAAGDDDLTKGTSDLLRRLEIVEGTIIPTKISAVTPTVPGVRAVPRAGQRAIGTEKPNVPVAFEKLVAIEGD